MEDGHRFNHQKHGEGNGLGSFWTSQHSTPIAPVQGQWASKSGDDKRRHSGDAGKGAARHSGYMPGPVLDCSLHLDGGLHPPERQRPLCQEDQLMRMPAFCSGSKVAHWASGPLLRALAGVWHTAFPMQRHCYVYNRSYLTSRSQI